MHDSRRYRDSAAECLFAAQEASQPHSRKLHLSMAISWLSLARKYEAIERLFQGPDIGWDEKTMRHKAGRSLEAKPPKRGNESDHTERALRILEGARGLSICL
jgi:hypothetical protein